MATKKSECENCTAVYVFINENVSDTADGYATHGRAVHNLNATV